MMASFRQSAYAPIMIYLIFYASLLMAIFCSDSSEAFSTSRLPKTSSKIDSSNLNRKRSVDKDGYCLHTLSMVANIPSSSITNDSLNMIDFDDIGSIVDDTDDHDDYDTSQDLSALDTMEIKHRLLDLLPRMTGTEEEYSLVESCVNTLEDRYAPVQTIDFLNLAMAGDWQLLFSTNIGSSSLNFQLRELCQKIDPDGFNGTIVNEATWDLAEDDEDSDTVIDSAAAFNAHGSFSIKCGYSIRQGSRMNLELNDHAIQLSKGSAVPKDIQRLVGLLHRAIPGELFDPDDHAMDTTYLDGDLRIVRMAGPKFEAVRNIFLRRSESSLQIDS